MKHNGDHRAEDIQAHIQRTRSHMDATLTAIESRLTPGQLMDRGIDYLRHSGGTEFVHNLGRQAKSNPMPVALAGIALAWLMAASKTAPNAATSPSPWDGESGTGESARDRMGHVADSVKEQIGHAKESLSGTAAAARERVSGVAASARGTYYRARGGYESMLRDHPLALGAVGLAIGAVLAAALPRTRKEDELMGDSSDRLAETAKEIGRERLEQARDVAKTAIDAAKVEAQKQDITPGGT